MNVFHLYFDSDIEKNLQVISRSFDVSDVLVVSPSVGIMSDFGKILDKQLVKREDALVELTALGDNLKALSKDTMFSQLVDTTMEKIYNTLQQGMVLTFLDKSLASYLKAFIVNLCSQCVAGYISDSEFIDGRSVILCESNNGIQVVDWKLTEKHILDLTKDRRIILGGSYGRKVSGETIDLGRQGSELTANIIGAIKGADRVRFYVKDFTYDESSTLSYEEAAQRFSGGSPIYPPSMLPAKKAGLKVEVADLVGGDVMVNIATIAEEKIAKGITGVVVSEPMSLLTVYGTGLLGSIGTSSAIFGALAKCGLNVHFISQTQSEYSISFAVKRHKESLAKEAIRGLINDTRQANFNDISFSILPVKVVSVFGQGMRKVPGISGKVYSTLGCAGINVIAASQGGEELSISIVVDEKDAERSKAVLSAITQN